MLMDEEEVGEVGIAPGHQDEPRRADENKQHPARDRLQSPQHATIPGNEDVTHQGCERDENRNRTLREHGHRRGDPGSKHPESPLPCALGRGFREQKCGERRAHEKRKAGIQRIEMPDDEVERRTGQHQPRQQSHPPIEQPRARKGRYQDAQKARQPRPQFRHPRLHAEGCVAERRDPVLQRRLLEIHDTVETRRHPVAGNQHLARNFGVPRFVGLRQNGIAEGDEPEHRQGGRPQDAKAP